MLRDSLHWLTKRCKVTLQWIPALCGISGNEKADSLANDGSSPLLSEKQSSSWRGSSKMTGAAWVMATIQSKTPLQLMDRNQAWTIYHLRTACPSEENWCQRHSPVQLPDSKSDTSTRTPRVSPSGRPQKQNLARRRILKSQAVGRYRRPQKGCRVHRSHMP